MGEARRRAKQRTEQEQRLSSINIERVASTVRSVVADNTNQGGQPSTAEMQRAHLPDPVVTHGRLG